MKKRTKKQKSNFSLDLINALNVIGEKHKLCCEHTIKETFCIVAKLIRDIDGKKELESIYKHAKGLK